MCNKHLLTYSDDKCHFCRAATHISRVVCFVFVRASQQTGWNYQLSTYIYCIVDIKCYLQLIQN